MASSFKIPKKKHPAGSDSAPVHMQSPLSRLQRPATQFKSYGDESDRGGADRMHAGNAVGSSADRQSAPSKPFFRDVVKTLLGLNSPKRGASTANHRATGRCSSQSQPGQRAELSCSSDRWRPKRASDCLLQPAELSEHPSPPQKKKSELRGSSPTSKSISVNSLDSLAELQALEHAGRSSSLTWRRVGTGVDVAEGKSDRGNSPQRDSSEDDVPSLFRPSNKLSAQKSLHRPSVSTATPDRRRSLDRTSWLVARSNLPDELMVKKRQTWSEFRERKTAKRSAILQLRLNKERQTEPIVLSSEEEEEEEDGGRRTTPSSRKEAESHLGNSEQKQEGDKARQVSSSTDEPPPPSYLQLEFSSLHAGLTHVHANGKVMISEHGVTIPLKGASCSFLLLVLKEQLKELQAALLASILDMEEYRRGFSSASSGLTSPLEWTDGLLLLHSCAPPLDRHLLGLLGHSAEKSSESRNNQRNNKSYPSSSGLKQLPSRLIQYPAAPCKGRISVSKEDLACLAGGEFLNDVIIDFYLKYLLLEGVGGLVAERSHVFSSFFYKQLSRRKAAGEDDAPSVPDRHTRHQRVKTWTRHVDIFTKDFLFVPVNQEAHWFLVVVCFPGLEDVQYLEFQSPTGGSETTAGKTSVSLRSQHPPDCTQQGRHRDTVLKRPCILVMDSLKLSYRENVCRLLRDYLQVEWEVRRGTPRLFTSVSMRSSNCRVPQQDNSSDCGLYLLQYAESFLQNPVVHFDLPLRLDNWFPRQRVRQKREEIRSLIMRMHQSQNE